MLQRCSGRSIDLLKTISNLRQAHTVGAMTNSICQLLGVRHPIKKTQYGVQSVTENPLADRRGSIAHAKIDANT